MCECAMLNSYFFGVNVRGGNGSSERVMDGMDGRRAASTSTVCIVFKWGEKGGGGIYARYT